MPRFKYVYESFIYKQLKVTAIDLPHSQLTVVSRNDGGQQIPQSVIGWVTKKLLSRAPCFGRHLKPLYAAFAVVSTHQSALGLRGELMPVLLMCNP
jgi:hypothetical protein